MASVHKFSAQVIDYAERLSDVSDAAQGKHRQKLGRTSRWLLLPASGAALYALFRSDSFSRQAKGVMDEAKNRAAELPDDLVGRVKQATSAQDGTQTRRSTTTDPRKRRTTRKTASASR
jgi:hypothetical protein